MAPPSRPAFSAAASSPAPVGLPTSTTKWPDAMHEYVKRAFARCKGPADQALTQNALKELITNAITTNSLWTRNWAVEPLPTLVGDAPVAKMLHASVPNGTMSTLSMQLTSRSVKKKAPKQNTEAASIAFNPPNAVAKKSKAAKRKLYVAQCGGSCVAVVSVDAMISFSLLVAT